MGALAGPGRPDDEQECSGVELERKVVKSVDRGAGVAESEPVGSDRDGPRPMCKRSLDQAGNPSRTPVWRRAETIPTATSGRTTRPEKAMNPASTVNAPTS
jgi:hypothetical protein